MPDIRIEKFSITSLGRDQQDKLGQAYRSTLRRGGAMLNASNFYAGGEHPRHKISLIGCIPLPEPVQELSVDIEVHTVSSLGNRQEDDLAQIHESIILHGGILVARHTLRFEQYEGVPEHDDLFLVVQYGGEASAAS